MRLKFYSNYKWLEKYMYKAKENKPSFMVHILYDVHNKVVGWLVIEGTK